MAKNRLFLDGKEIITANEPTFHIEGGGLSVTPFCNGSVYSEKTEDKIVIDEVALLRTDEQQDFWIQVFTGDLDDDTFELEIKNDIDKNYYLKTLSNIKRREPRPSGIVLLKFTTKQLIEYRIN